MFKKVKNTEYTRPLKLEDTDWEVWDGKRTRIKIDKDAKLMVRRTKKLKSKNY